MKKIKEFNQVGGVLLTNQPIIQKKESLHFIDQHLNAHLIIEGDIYYARVINGELFFQFTDENNLNTIPNGQLISRKGSWGLTTAFSVSSDRFYIHYQGPEPSPKFLIVNSALETVKESIKDCNYGIKNLLFSRFRNKIVCYDSLTNEAKWESEQSAIINQGIMFFEDHVFITLKTGELVALNIFTGEFKWKQSRVGRTAIFKDKIYCIADYKIIELNADSGEILRTQSIQELVDTYQFRPTGEHKVYDEFIFCMASGKPGMIAVYDRKNLKFLELIKLDEMIPMGLNHLYWHSERLYVLDFGNTLHVYE